MNIFLSQGRWIIIHSVDDLVNWDTFNIDYSVYCTFLDKGLYYDNKLSGLL